MRVLYDHQIFAMQRFGGISRYFVELMKRIACYADIEVEVLAPLHVNQYLHRMDSVWGYGNRMPKVPYSARLFRNINAPVVYALQRLRRPDVVHETYYFPVKLARRKTPTVVTVFDMIHERYPQYFSKLDPTARNKARAVKRASHVICISESTRRDLLDRLAVDPARVSVVHLGTAMEPVTASSAAKTPVRPFLLFVGQRRGYKNFANLLQAYASSRSLRREYGLVCFGGGGFDSAERDAIGRYGLGLDRVVQISGDDAGLAALYSSATALIYPSLYEGFGIPIVEAMSMGCPVACSDTSSMPEVAGDAVMYFDPLDAGSIAAAMEKLLGSDETRNELIVRGREHAKQFSWERCAGQTCEIYRGLNATGSKGRR